MYSDFALKIYALQQLGIEITNLIFWLNTKKISQNQIKDMSPFIDQLDEKDISLICAFDEGFPQIDRQLFADETPFLFAYRGDLSLLKDIERNVAVVGSLEPSEEVISREKKVVKRLVKKGFNIISGLAAGCDTVAHRECLARGGKTVAFLPTTFSNIYPKENAKLAEEIVESGGLVITEYVTETIKRQERIGRFIARDRLQALFSSRVVLIASHLPYEGDSGSRHAMEKAKEYGRERYVMYREEDLEDQLFGLNRQILQDGGIVLTPKLLEKF